MEKKQNQTRKSIPGEHPSWCFCHLLLPFGVTVEHQLIEASWGPFCIPEAWWQPRGRWLNSWHSSRYLCTVTSVAGTEDSTTCLTVIFQGVKEVEASLWLGCTGQQQLPASSSFVLPVSWLLVVLFSSTLTSFFPFFCQSQTFIFPSVPA